MLIKVPVVYDEEVVPKRATNPRRMHFGEWIEVEVREVDDIDAPVAMRWKSDSDRNYGNLDGIVELRWFDNTLWRPSIESESDKSKSHLSAEKMIKKTADGYSYGNPIVAGIDWKIRDLVSKKVEPLDADAFRTIYTSNRTSAISNATQRAKVSLIVDGMVYVAVTEPVYMVDHRTYVCDGNYTSLEIVSATSCDGRHEDAFRVDRFEDAQALALSKYGTEIDITNKIEIFIHEAIQYDDEYPALAEALDIAVRHGESNLAEKDKGTIVAWVDLRDALATLWQDKNDETIAEALTAAQVWSVINTDENDKRKLLSAIERWENRPIALSFSLSQDPSFKM